MLLVLISLMMATILSLSYLASRDNSGVIGENIASAAAARWGTGSALDLGLAVLQTETPWRAAPGGRLLDGVPLPDGGAATVLATDLATDAPPTDDSEYIELTAIAAKDGIEQVTKAEVYVPATPPGTVDIDLSEFAVFARERIELRDRAVVTRWPKAPLVRTGRPIAFATQALDSGEVRVDADAAAIDTILYHAPGASDHLVSCAGDTMPTLVELPDPIPMPASPPSGMPEPGAVAVAGINLNGAITTYGGLRRCASASLSNTTLTLQDGTTFVVDDDLSLSGSTVRVLGNAVIVVYDQMSMSASSIALASTAVLRLMVRRDLTMTDSYIGQETTGNPRDPSGSAAYMDPERVCMYGLAVDPGAMFNWDLSGTSVVKGSVYAPNARVRIKGTSALYGRAAAREVRLADDGALFYDPALDSRRGYAGPESALYDEGGRLLDAFSGLASLSEAALAAAAEAADTVILAPGAWCDDVAPAAAIVDDGALADGGAAVTPGVTPRTVRIEWRIVSVGSDVRDWEAAAHD
jgi:hypothetical protein